MQGKVLQVIWRELKSPQPSVQPGPSGGRICLCHLLQQAVFTGGRRRQNRLWNFHPFPPPSSFLLSLFLFFQPFCFTCFILFLLTASFAFPPSTFQQKKNNKQNKTSLFGLSSNVNHSCFYTFTYILVLLFTRSLLSAVSVVGTALGSGHTVVHRTYPDHSRMGLTVKRVI